MATNDLFLNPNLSEEQRRAAKELAAKLIEEVAAAAAGGADVLSDALSEAIRESVGAGNISGVSKEMQALGLSMMEGTADGIMQGTNASINALAEANNSAIEAEKRYQEEEKRLDEEHQQKLYQERLRNAKTYEAAEKIRRAERLRLEKVANDEYIAGLKAAAEEESRILKEQQDQIKLAAKEREQQKNAIVKMYTEIVDIAAGKMNEVIKLQEKMEQKLTNVGGLFEAGRNKFIGQGKDGRDLIVDYTNLRDLTEDIKTLEQYKDALFAVRERGAPDGFFDVLRNLSVEDALRFTTELMKLNDEGFDEYISAWEKKQEMAAEITRQLYQDETESAVKYMGDAFKEAGMQIPAGFFTNGQDAAESFGEGFVVKLSGVMEKIKSALSEEMKNIVPVLSIPAGGSSAASGTTVYNSPVYHLAAAGSTVAEQLQAIHDAETVNKLRGGS